MTQTPRIDFIGKWVVYTSVIDGGAYQSLHKRSTMTDAEASKAFLREHQAEVLSMLVEKHKNENLLISN